MEQRVRIEEVMEELKKAYDLVYDVNATLRGVGEEMDKGIEVACDSGDYDELDFFRSALDAKDSAVELLDALSTVLGVYEDMKK